MTTIKQLLIREWEGNKGKNQDILGLGEDNNIYLWNRFEAKWSLYKINTTVSTQVDNEPF